MLSRLGAKHKLEIQVKDGGLFIAPVYDNSRKGWAEAFARAAKKYEPEGDYFDGAENDFDKEGWTL